MANWRHHYNKKMARLAEHLRNHPGDLQASARVRMFMLEMEEKKNAEG